MIRFFYWDGCKSVTNFNDIIKYILHDKTAGFSCDTQFEADMLNYIINNESYGEVYKPGRYWWVDDEGEYILKDDIGSYKNALKVDKNLFLP